MCLSAAFNLVLVDVKDAAGPILIHRSAVEEEEEEAIGGQGDLNLRNLIFLIKNIPSVYLILPKHAHQ